VTHGTLEERDILTKGDRLNPPRKGAVLYYTTSYSYATLKPHTSTKSTRLDGHQEVFYIASGHGTVSAGGENADLVKISQFSCRRNLISRSRIPAMKR